MNLHKCMLPDLMYTPVYACLYTQLQTEKFTDVTTT